MKNIKKIFERFTESLVRTRALPFLLSVQNIVFAILVLIYANIIISRGKINGELDYDRIKLFYNLVIYILYFLVFIYAPYFLAGALNGLYKNNTIEYLLSTRMNIKEITYAAFLRGFANVLILIVSTFPIACVSLYFGGMGIVRVLRIIICLISFSMLLSSICLYISSFYKERNATVLVSYVICFFIFLLHMFLLKYIINLNFVTFLYFLFANTLSLIFIVLAYKGRIFND